MGNALDKVQYEKWEVKRLDDIVRKKVHARGFCQLCGATDRGLTWAHIMRRRFLHTCWDLDNALALCLDCHTRVDSSKGEMRFAVAKVYGPHHYDELVARSRESATRSYDELVEGLTGR